MPVYEYVCPSCDHQFEELLRSSHEAPVACPECGRQETLRKPSVFSARTPAAQPQVPIGQACGRCGDPNGPCGS